MEIKFRAWDKDNNSRETREVINMPVFNGLSHSDLSYMGYVNGKISDLEEKIITRIEVDAGKTQVLFTLEDGEQYLMYHDQDCCESVFLSDICGDFDDLLNVPIYMARECIGNSTKCDDHDSITWTFYNFATKKGYVTLRWNGDSNGYYSESVDFIKLKKK